MDNKNHPGTERKALGRGLAALLNTNSASQNKNPSNLGAGSTIVEGGTKSSLSETNSTTGFLTIEISKISPNPNQPRKFFNEEKLLELAMSLKEQGLVQPIVVRKVGNDQFQIVAGERRWRAAKLADLKELPVIVREEAKDEQDNDLASLVENIQREELNPIELARAYDRVFETHQFTQEKLAEKLGISRVSLANTLRLLKLPESVQNLVASGKLSEGHSRALLSLNGEKLISEMADRILAENLSVRDVENRVRVTVVGQNFATINKIPQANMTDTSAPASASSTNAAPASKSAELLQIEDELRQLFGTKVIVKGGGHRGAIEIFYSGGDSFHRILHQIRSLQK